MEKLSKFIPVIHGVDAVGDNEVEITMENLLDGYVNPSVIDIKLGQGTFNKDEVDPKKLKKKTLMDASSTSEEHGYRVTGHQIKDN